MSTNFAVIGGDLRISTLAKLLAEDGNNVFVYGMENANFIEENTKIIKCKSVEEAVKSSNIIIGSIPFSKSKNEMYAIFSEEHIQIDELIKGDNSKKIFIAGSISEDSKEILEKNYMEVVDIMEYEQLAILNTIATAEGAIEVAIKNTDTILHGKNVLILGFGRVAKIVAKKFQGLSANITCAARKPSDFAWITALGYNLIDINTIETEFWDFDIVINTVPKIIVDKDRMKFMKKNVLLIDLASEPGGFDKNDAKTLDLKLICALALPGKIAPVTSAEFIKQTIYDNIL